MNERLNRDETGAERRPMPIYRPQQPIKNCYCPRDGHYCEHPDCDNCMFETVGGGIEQ